MDNCWIDYKGLEVQMTAEEKLKELYRSCDFVAGSYILKDSQCRVMLSPLDIDLITNLVVERLRR